MSKKLPIPLPPPETDPMMPLRAWRIFKYNPDGELLELPIVLAHLVEPGQGGMVVFYELVDDMHGVRRTWLRRVLYNVEDIQEDRSMATPPTSRLITH